MLVQFDNISKQPQGSPYAYTHTKAYDSNSLEHFIVYEIKHGIGWSSNICWRSRSFHSHAHYDDNDCNQGQCTRFCQLWYIPVKWERVRYKQRKEWNAKPSVSKNPNNGHLMNFGKQGSYDMWNRVAYMSVNSIWGSVIYTPWMSCIYNVLHTYDYTVSAHATKCKRKLKDGNCNQSRSAKCKFHQILICWSAS